MQWRRTIFCTLAVLALLTVVTAVFFVIVRQQMIDGCIKGSFPCDNTSHICVAQKAICNGHQDCPGGEDELPFVQCHDYHGSSYVFNFFTNKTSIPETYHICNITYEDERCICKNATRLYCAELGLSSVPSGISTNVTKLILNDNAIEQISMESFSKYPSLELIHLEGNLISEIPPECFKYQENLTTLFINNNRLVHLQAGALVPLPKLSFLVLENNFLESIDMTNWTQLESLGWLSLINNSLSLKSFNSFPHLINLSQLELDNNSIESVEEDTFARLFKLSYLSLKNNKVKFIHPNAFRNLKLLKELNLSGNQLITLYEDIFSQTVQMAKLYLDHNPFVYIPSQLFAPLKNLTSLDLQKIEIENIDIKMFSLLTKLDFIYFKNFHYCAFAPNVPKCKPNTDGISSSEDLLSRPMIRILLWIVAAITVCGNGLVLWGRYKSHDENRVLSLIIRNLAVSDGLMAIYLTTIGIQDEITRGFYHREAHRWMASWQCTAIGTLALISSEVSILILVFMSVERYLIIANPFGGHKNALSLAQAISALAVIWSTGIVLAILPVIHWKDATRFYGTNGMCFPLHIAEPFLLGWEYSAFIFLGLNFSGLIVLGGLYIGMFISIYRTRNATSVSSIDDVDLAIRFFFIVLSDTLCWLPIIALKFAALCGHYIPADLYAWMVVLILPVNSAVNPLLYTFTTPKYKNRLCRPRFHRSTSGGQELIAPKQNSLNDTETAKSIHRVSNPKPSIQIFTTTAFPA